MSTYLSSKNFPGEKAGEKGQKGLQGKLQDILQNDLGKGDMIALLARWQKVAADNSQKKRWPEINDKLQVLFQCGQAVALDGPMIGISLTIRDSDLLQPLAQAMGQTSSPLANMGLLASLWNSTFAPTGLWMGKTFEQVERSVVEGVCDNNPGVLAGFEQGKMRIGRNFFREVAHPNALTSLGLPVLTQFWHLQDRPNLTAADIFQTRLSEENWQKEGVIPYSKTGGIFLADMGQSVVPGMNGKPVYQLNYRWPNLQPAFPMSLLIDELVQVDDGVYLGQLVMATHHPHFVPPGTPSPTQLLPAMIKKGLGLGDEVDYGYQNNGYFLMIDSRLAARAYADDGFAMIRPHAGEAGYAELGYDKAADAPQLATVAAHQEGNVAFDWVAGWKNQAKLAEKFVTLTLEDSPKAGDNLADVKGELRPGESVLQMIKRLSDEVAEASRHDDKIERFEKLNRLFRCGMAPQVKDGLFAPQSGGYNTRIKGSKERQWYGQSEPLTGYDYYHGATLDLHFGFGDNQPPDLSKIALFDKGFLPTDLLNKLSNALPDPNLLDGVWKSIGKYIFPWAGKSFEAVSGRKLSMFLDEGPHLALRYPKRVQELMTHPASLPHFDLVLKAAAGYWPDGGVYAPNLSRGSWDQGMPAVDRDFWTKEANDHWVFGNNIQDERILAADPLFRALDMNYGKLDPKVEEACRASGSPFVRQGYIFLGVSQRNSILPMNNGDKPKEVFQFHYRYPMLGGAFPIGLCLDELVEVSPGLFLGQLIYATNITKPFHSSTPTDEYKYQLFGYFMLMDDDWEKHRQAIGLDVWRKGG